MKKQPPQIFRPFVWWTKWEDIDVQEDKEDLVVSAVNEGTLDHWRWLMKTYGKEEIRSILQKRLDTEFHPESRNLAKLIFSVSDFRHARGSAH
ncbi:MAG TPA: hypothetical protein VGA53_00560 [Candidatus Paceibacterota bacterium]